MRLTSARTRLALSHEFQSYPRVVIILRGAKVIRRNRPAGEARPLTRHAFTQTQGGRFRHGKQIPEPGPERREGGQAGRVLHPVYRHPERG